MDLVPPTETEGSLPAEYEIVSFDPDLKTDVVHLLCPLWGEDPTANLDHFRWKYEENPYADGPVGVAALHQGKVVGFRGYFPSLWNVNDGKCIFTVLSPGDTVVDPGHRKKGLSVAMAWYAMTLYAPRYKVFLNLSASRSSTPGYLKLGFVPIVDKTCLARYSLPGLLAKRWLPVINKASATDPFACQQDENGRLIHSNVSWPEEMSEIVIEQANGFSGMTPWRDETFFRWRYRNRKIRYTFFYLRENNTITGYIVLRQVRGRFRTGGLVDYAAVGPGGLRTMLRCLVELKQFDILLMPDWGLQPGRVEMLNRIGFRKDSLFEKRQIKRAGVWPLLVRPTIKNPEKDDWFIEGLDMRKIENWDIKEISSDGI